MRKNNAANLDNNTDNYETDDARMGLNNRDDSDNGSGIKVSFMHTLCMCGEQYISFQFQLLFKGYTMFSCRKKIEVHELDRWACVYHINYFFYHY